MPPECMPHSQQGACSAYYSRPSTARSLREGNFLLFSQPYEACFVCVTRACLLPDRPYFARAYTPLSCHAARNSPLRDDARKSFYTHGASSSRLANTRDSGQDADGMESSSFTARTLVETCVVRVGAPHDGEFRFHFFAEKSQMRIHPIRKITESHTRHAPAPRTPLMRLPRL